MKKLILPLFTVFSFLGLSAQVTQINSNKSLVFEYPLSNSKAIVVSHIDSTLWATDGSLNGTIQLSAGIKLDRGVGGLTFLDGKYIFVGETPATGREVYITDGTPGGTLLVKDINPGTTGSAPVYVITANGYIYFTAETLAEGNELWRTDGTPGGTTLVKDINPGAPGSSIDNSDIALLNGFLYFMAETVAEGRELWKTDGTPGGTSLVKDIVQGTGGSNYPGAYNLLSANTYLLFMARTPASGVELWVSDGTGPGTVLLKDINPGIDSSAADLFQPFNNLVYFSANDGVHGNEIWETNGTPGGTVLLKDINPGIGSSTTFDFLGFSFPIFTGFHVFNDHAIFRASDGTSTGELWITDGTANNTSLLKNVVAGNSISTFSLNALNLSSKFIFPVFDGASRSELWESDGTPGNTKILKSFDGSGILSLLPAFNFTPFQNQLLFQGNKVFFLAKTVAEGNELWITDGTVANTQMVKDINPGPTSGISAISSYIYTSSALFFPANNGTNGLELWRSDGTPGGTNMVADLITGAAGSKPRVDFFLVNNLVLFEADNGDDPVLRDLYAVNGTFVPLPVSLTYFTVKPKAADAILNWQTSQELNSKDFAVQRSFDGLNFSGIGTIAAAGTSNLSHDYSFTDIGVMNSGQNTVYYRLQNTDIDGKISFSPVITLKSKRTENWDVRLLANPVLENIQIILSGITENVQLSIIDMSGKKIATYLRPAINGQLSLPASGIARGRYVLLVETANEKKTFQFVK